MYAAELLQKTLYSIQARGKQVAQWGDAQASRALSLASTALWAPVTLPIAMFHFSVGLYPVQALLLKPLQYLQMSSSEGRLIKLILTEGDGTVLGVQPVWVGWQYNVSGIIDLLEKHLALQERKVWVDSLGACHLRLRGTTFEALPDAAQAKDFALPLVTLAALVQPRAVSLDAALGAVGGATVGARGGSPSPQKKKPAGSFFVLPANATGTAGGAAVLGALASHPINVALSPGISDMDSPASSPTAASTEAPAAPRFSPFK